MPSLLTTTASSSRCTSCAAAPGRPLLLLHGLGERSPAARAGRAREPGRARCYALDFTGHGESTVPRGGGYTAEMLMGDADAALAHLGEATVVGRGLGAYVALLCAGARPEARARRDPARRPGPRRRQLAARHADRAAARPGARRAARPVRAGRARRRRPPARLRELVRAPGHAPLGARAADLVCTVERPDWLRAVIEEPGVEVCELEAALAQCARGASRRSDPDAR